MSTSTNSQSSTNSLARYGAPIATGLHGKHGLEGILHFRNEGTSPNENQISYIISGLSAFSEHFFDRQQRASEYICTFPLKIAVMIVASKSAPSSTPLAITSMDSVSDEYRFASSHWSLKNWRFLISLQKDRLCPRVI
jgi:hypothetical protein